MTHDVVQTILTALPEVQADRARLNRERRDRPPDLVPATMPSENVRRNELRRALMSFDAESLLKAEALYYYGRDGGDMTFDMTFVETLEYLRGLDEPKDWIVSTLLEKLPACALCFAQAEADLRKKGLSIETV